MVHEVPSQRDRSTPTTWADHGFSDVQARLWQAAGIIHPEDAAALARLSLAPRQIPIPLGVAGTTVEVRVLRQDARVREVQAPEPIEPSKVAG